ncbi:MAG: DUF2851 family protein [Flammeovirgaceae bacterium]|nr:MAG: DUF2851 family protein [Flammeovirgaceae bacterium]
MTESFLHYVWQFQYFDKKELFTSGGETIEVFNPGIKNADAGPDFSDARIKIGALEWRGSVEIHIQASGWVNHHHDADAAYERVILHVVWEEDKVISRSDGTRMPTLVLKARVDPELWKRYRNLITSAETIPCAHSVLKVDPVIRLSMMDKVLLQRLEKKALLVIAFLEQNKGDWNETTFQLLARNFGFRVNAEPFEQLANVLAYRIILKHVNQPMQVEALLFGMAGMLEKVEEDEYTTTLKKEFALLAHKYGLANNMLNKAQWRFLRLRPANFPTVRLAQFATLLSNQSNLFSTFINADHKQLVEALAIRQSAYWLCHYQFGKEVKSVPVFGKSSIDGVLINTVVPLLVAYGKQQDDQQYIDRAVSILQHIPAEKNAIIKQYLSLGLEVKSSFDSQALLELYADYCRKRRCLECTIGASLVKPK